MSENSMFYINLDRDFNTRYDLGKFLHFNIDNYDPLTSSILHEIKSLKLGGKYVVRGEDGRPDLLSYRIYNKNVDYWWIIMAYNGFTKMEHIVNGDEILYPQYQALEAFYFSLNIKQKLNNNGN